MSTKNKKLRIGFVLDDTLDSSDGVQQYVLTLGQWLALNGHEVHYIVGESHRKDISNLHSMSKNLSVRFNKNRLSIPLLTDNKAIKEKISELDLDILHIQMPYSPFFAGKVISSAAKKTKIIGTFHILPVSLLQSLGTKWLHLINKKTLKKFKQIISVSSAAQEFAKNTLGIESIVIPNVVNSRVFKQKQNKKSLKPNIVFLGRLVERKGCMELLKALELLQNNYSGEYEVIIAGKGPLKNKLEKYTSQHNIKNVKFIGYINESDKPSLLSSAQIAVFPSTGGESFGIVLLEAMAAGAEVIIGGNNEGYKTVLKEHNLLIVDPRNTEDFANKLKYFLTNKNARDKAHKWAQQHIKQFDINLVGQKIIEVYNV